MRRISRYHLGVTQGSVLLFQDFQDGGAMWTGTGPRESRHRQSFAESFAEPPLVQLGLSMWDIDHRAHSRVDLRAEAIDCTGFDLVFRTWGDSRIARARADWTAFGTLDDADDWQVD